MKTHSWPALNTPVPLCKGNYSLTVFHCINTPTLVWSTVTVNALLSNAHGAFVTFTPTGAVTGVSFEAALPSTHFTALEFMYIQSTKLLIILFLI